jgi:hypothetical protein
MRVTTGVTSKALLTPGQRSGQYPGLSEQREFRVVRRDVQSNERPVSYDGQPIVVDL